MDQSFVSYGEALCLLVDVPEKGSNLRAAFEKNIKNVCDKLAIDNFSVLQSLKEFGVKVDENSDFRWKWVSLALHIFLSLKEMGQEKELLLSVRQEKGVKSCLEFIISMGILPSLIPGVGIPLSKRCSTAAVQWIINGDQDKEYTPNSMIELHERLSAVTKVLLSCIEADFLRGPILSKHLCDILAALCQLSMAPLKKPCDNHGVKQSVVDQQVKSSQEDENSCSSIFSKKRPPPKKSVLVTEVDEGKNVDDVFKKKNEDFIMTTELWNYLQKERKTFCKILEDLVHDMYQPLVIRDLISLLGSPDKSAEKGKPAPMWLRRGCSNLLNSCLFRKDGIVATVRAICDVYSVPKSKPNSDSWAQHVILGKLFVMAVKSKKGNDSCCQSICSQVIELLSAENLRDSKEYARAGLACVSMLWDEDEEICKHYILKCIFPFMNEDGQEQMKVVCQVTDSLGCADDHLKNYGCKKEESKFYSGRQTSIPDFEIDSSLELIHFCYVENDPGMSLPSRLLAPVFPILLRKFHCVKTEFNRKSIIKSVLIKFLVSCADESLLSQTLNSVLFEGSYNSGEIERLAQEKEHSESGTQDLGGNEEELLKDILERHLGTETLGKPVEEINGEHELGWGSIPLLDIVSSDGGGEAAEVLFRYILKVFPKVGEKSSVCNESEWLLCIGKQSVAIKILCQLLEVPAVSEQVRKHPINVVKFLGNFLSAEAEKVFGKKGRFQVTDETGDLADRCKTQTDDSLLNVSGESSFPSFLNFSSEETNNQIPEIEVGKESVEENHSEFVLVALLILKSLCDSGNDENEENWWEPLRSILPQIRAFRRESSCPEVRSMAEDLACAILTKGKVGTSAAGSFSERVGNHSKAESKKNFPPECQVSCDQRPAESKESEFEAALKMAHETAVHLRGHALIRLSKLIKSKDAVTLRHKSTLLELFQANLKHDDSYIYLAAINGLEQLGNMFPDQVLESLADEFAEIGIVKAGDAAFNNIRLKVGEALLKVTRTLGEMIPKYSTLLLNAFLGGVRDGDGLVRASCLSNLGEVCKLLSFRIGSIITEILWCVRCVLETDVAVEARRAAVLVITLLLQGMGVEIFKVLEAVLPEMYRTLKTVRDKDSDEIVRIHAEMALEEVNRITKEFLFPQPKLQKKIFVLDAPS